MKLTNPVKTKIDALIASICKPGSPGCVVGIVQSGEMVYGKGFGWANLEHASPIGVDTVFDVGSMAKQFVGMAAALLEEDGRLAITDEISLYLPDLPEYAQGVTVADLLYHTSGIRNYTVLAYYMMGYHESDAITREEVYDLLKSLKTRNFAPGERYEYSDSNYFLLAKIIEAITGETLGVYTDRNIFQPLGMKHTLFRECHSQVIPNRAVSYVLHPIEFQSPAAYRQFTEPSNVYHALTSNYEHVGAEGLFTCLNDLVRWDRNFIENRSGKEKQKLIEGILTPGKIRINERIGYGYGINIGMHKGEAFYGHDGAIHGYTSSMLHFPDKDTTLICLTNQNQLAAWTIRDRIMELIFASSATQAAAQAEQVSHSSMVDTGDISGFYQNPKTADVWEVKRREGEVVIEVNRGWQFNIKPIEPSMFQGMGSNKDLLIRFIQDDAGHASQIHGSRGKEEFVFQAFLSNGLTTDELQEYVGEYHCEELKTTFRVEVKGNNIWLKNQNRHFCSMDLIYEPTIKDHFIAYDPHPLSNQITFLRDHGSITAFIYRDCDGDGREALQFISITRKS